MARYPALADATTIVTQPPVGASGPTARGRFVSRVQRVLPMLHLAPGATLDPSRLDRFLQDILLAVRVAIRPAVTNPRNSSVIMQGLSWTSGTQVTILHGLQRPWRGYSIVRSSGAAPVLVRDVSLPAGFTADMAIALIPNATGTADLEVF